MRDPNCTPEQCAASPVAVLWRVQGSSEHGVSTIRGFVRWCAGATLVKRGDA
jgi:hypothetical protein